MVQVPSQGTTSGGMIDRNCGCHLLVNSYKQAQSGDIELKCEVLMSSEKSQIGKSHTEFFPISGKPGAVKRTFEVAKALGIYTQEQHEADDKSGNNPDLAFEDVEGREFLADVVIEPYAGKKEENKGKSFPKINYGIYSVDSDRADHIPRDPDSPLMQQLAKRGRKPGSKAGGGGNGNAGGGGSSSGNGNGNGSKSSQAKRETVAPGDAGGDSGGGVNPDLY